MIVWKGVLKKVILYPDTIERICGSDVRFLQVARHSESLTDVPSGNGDKRGRFLNGFPGNLTEI